MVDDQEEGEFARTTPRSPEPNESQDEGGDAVTASPPMTTDEGNQQAVIGWPQISEANATLQIRSFAKIDAIESHGEPMFQKRRTRELIREKRGPEGRVAISWDLKFPWGEKALRFISENGPDLLKDFRKKQNEELRKKARQRRQGTDKWRNSLSDAQRMVQGRLNLPPSAHVMNKLGTGGQKRAHQFTNGCLKEENQAAPGVDSTRTNAYPELTPQQSLTNSRWRVKARRASVTDTPQGAPRTTRGGWAARFRFARVENW